MFVVRVDSSDSQLGLGDSQDWRAVGGNVCFSTHVQQFLFLTFSSVHGHKAEDSYNVQCVERGKWSICHRGCAIFLAFQAVFITQRWTLLIHHSFIQLSIHVFIYPSIHSSNSCVCLQTPPLSNLWWPQYFQWTYIRVQGKGVYHRPVANRCRHHTTSKPCYLIITIFIGHRGEGIL